MVTLHFLDRIIVLTLRHVKITVKIFGRQRTHHPPLARHRVTMIDPFPKELTVWIHKNAPTQSVFHLLSILGYVLRLLRHLQCRWTRLMRLLQYYFNKRNLPCRLLRYRQGCSTDCKSVKNFTIRWDQSSFCGTSIPLFITQHAHPAPGAAPKWCPVYTTLSGLKVG